VNIVEQRVDIRIEWPSGKPVRCPNCGKACSLKDHREERVWRHLDTMQFKTLIHCCIPRSDCGAHGVKTVSVPWSEPNSRWTLMFEAFAVTVLGLVPSIAKAQKILGLSWDETHAIKKRAVRRGLKRRKVTEIEHVGIDEKSFGVKERFVTILNDLDGERVLEVAPSKSMEAAKTVCASIPQEEREKVQAVAMDMTAAFERVCREMFPKSETVYDKFHIEQLLTKAMDTVRRKEHKLLLAQGITIFTKTRYIWLKRPERWSEKQKQHFEEVNAAFASGKFAQTKIARAWSLKEGFRGLWNYAYRGTAARYFKRWYFWATHSRLEPMIKAARTMKAHLEGILAYFHHGITNAYSEGINSTIQDLKSAARGFRSFPNYRIAILFACGKLEMQP
jgi:transposase